MKYISSSIIPIIVLIVISYGLYKKVNIYDSFIEGVKDGIKTTVGIFPTIFTMILGINILFKSNIINDITIYLAPFFKLIKVPIEIIPLALLRPISGSSSLIIMDSILSQYGTDSYIGRIASIIQGSTDTTIYIISLYFGSVGIKKIRYSLVVGLLTDLFCVIAAIIVVNLFFY
jgi:spore maturation protein B